MSESPTDRSDESRAASPGRVRAIALAVLLAISVPLVLIAVLAGGGEDRSGSAVRVERTPGAQVPEVLVYVERDTNVPETAEGRSSVTVECLDASGAILAQQRHPWPFTDTDGGTVDAHVHQPVAPDRLDQLTRCRLAGTRGPLEGPVGGPSLR